MKRMILVISMVALFNSEDKSQNSNKYEYLPEFRGSKWGLTVSNIREIEKEPYLQTTIGFGQKIVSFEGEIAGFRARIDYVFKENKLVEGMYQVKADSFKNVFESLKEFYIDKLDYPVYWSVSHPNTEIQWKGDENGLCRGPEIYWEYLDGFIAIISEKYKGEFTISILYVHEKTIADYGKYVLFPYKIITEQ
jgi:hypothetical protein